MMIYVFILTLVIILCCQIVSVDSRPQPKKTNTLPKNASQTAYHSRIASVKTFYRRTPEDFRRKPDEK